MRRTSKRVVGLASTLGGKFAADAKAPTVQGMGLAILQFGTVSERGPEVRAYVTDQHQYLV